MKAVQTTLHRRVNITLPEETIALLGRVAPEGRRSHLIAEAIRYYIRRRSQAELKKRLAEGARRRAQRDLALAREWFFAEEEVWPAGGK